MRKPSASAAEHSAARAHAAAQESTLAGGFKGIANALKPMSRRGSISMAQARKAVQDYVRASSK